MLLIKNVSTGHARTGIGPLLIVGGLAIAVLAVWGLLAIGSLIWGGSGSDGPGGTTPGTSELVDEFGTIHIDFVGDQVLINGVAVGKGAIAEEILALADVDKAIITYDMDAKDQDVREAIEALEEKGVAAKEEFRE